MEHEDDDVGLERNPYFRVSISYKMLARAWDEHVMFRGDMGSSDGSSAFEAFAKALGL